MTDREAFQVGFLSWCADNGYTDEQTRAHVKKAMTKEAILGTLGRLAYAPIDLLKSFGPAALTALGVGAVGLPIAAGLTGGYAAAKMTDNDTDADEAKTDEVLSEYQRLTDQARRQTAMKHMQGLPTLAAGR